MKEMEHLRLGLDVGGVIHDWVRYLGTELDFTGPRYLETPPVVGAFTSIAKLNQESPFAGNIFFISRSMDEGERNLSWLAHQKFWEETGIDKSHFRDCVEREDKVTICKEIGITHYVDDRSEVLEHLIATVPNLYLFQGRAEEMKQHKGIASYITEVSSWDELLPLLLKARVL